MNREKMVEIFDKHTPNTPMTEEEMMIMFNVLMSEDKTLSIDIEELDKESEIYKHFQVLLESFQGQVFLKRLKHFTSLKMTLGAFAILLQHMPTPGSCVMNAFYLSSKLPEDTLVTVETFADVYPFGFFSETQLKEIWAAQKVSSEKTKEYTCVGAPDNMIDYVEVWKHV